MPRKEATTENSVSVGAGSFLIDKGNYNCTVTKFEDRAPTIGGEVKDLLSVEFTIMGGDFDGIKLYHDFFLDPADSKGEEQAMVDFLKFCNAKEEVAAKTPNGNSWLDPNTVTAIKLCVHGKTVMVENSHRKGKDQSGQEKMFNKISKFSYPENVGVDSTDTSDETLQQVVED